MERICLFPGTFDPITKGHVDIIERAVSLFDKMVIGIGTNSSKQPMYSLDQRIVIGNRLTGHYGLEYILVLPAPVGLPGTVIK